MAYPVIISEILSLPLYRCDQDADWTYSHLKATSVRGKSTESDQDGLMFHPGLLLAPCLR